MRSIAQNVFQCTFDFALLSTEETETTPSQSAELHGIQTASRVKCCSKCGESKSLQEFPKSRGNWDGYDSLCRQCNRAKCKERRERVKAAKEQIPLKAAKEQIPCESLELRGEARPSPVKRCIRCLETKSVDQFPKRPERKDGLDSWCTVCKIRQIQERRDRLRNARKLEELNALSAEELELSKTHKRCAKCQEWLPKYEYHANSRASDGLFCWCRWCCAKSRASHMTRERIREGALRRSYGLTLQQYDALLAEQGFVCACCKQPETHTNQFGLIPLAVDHDHRTGKIRGLLCSACNTSYGLLREDESRILALLSYHRQHQQS